MSEIHTAPEIHTAFEFRAALFALLAGGGLWVCSASPQEPEPLLSEPRPAVPILPERASGPPSACAACHLGIAEQWSTSAHALAWVDEAYQAAIATKRRPKSCHGCHAPVPLVGRNLARKPPPRKADLHLGVTCVTCHRKEDGTMAGPRGDAVPAHGAAPSEALDPDAADALCITCHRTTIGPVIGIARTFVEGDFAGRGLSCVGCHMAPIEMRFANREDGTVDPAVPTRPGRSHALQTPRDPAFLRLAFGLRWRTDDDWSRIEIANQAGHQIPGLSGREIHFTARRLDASGEELESSSLTIDTRAFLPADGVVEIPLNGSEGVVELTGVHVDPRSKAPIPFLEITLR